MIRALLARHTQRRRAGYTYTTHDALVRAACTQLPVVTDPADRAQLLLGVAISRAEMAHAHDQVHGHRWTDRRQRGISTSLAMEAALCRALYLVEQARADWTVRQRALPELEAAAGPVLDRMAADRAGTGNPALVAQLRVLVVPVVGERAARILDVLGGVW